MADVVGTGGPDNLVGTAGDDTVTGLGGNDTINDGTPGTADVDTLDGGDGNDFITINDARDTVIGGNGFDTLFFGFPPGPGGLEINLFQLWATGSMNFGTGSISGIERVGPTVSGTMDNDTIILGSNYFFDTTLLGQEGNDVLIGGSGNDDLRGFTGTDYLVGGFGNDILDGGLGNTNTLQGGAGNDTYNVFVAGDSIVEFANEGFDRISTQLTVFTLPTHVEELRFSSATPVVGIGSAGDDFIYGGAGADELFGRDGNDNLYGSDPFALNHGAANTMLGGTGSDNYWVYTAGDSIVELFGEGYDTVTTNLGSFVLPQNVETLIFRGTGSFVGLGNELNNFIEGGSGSDQLFGFGGDDNLWGGSQNNPDVPNTMIGGTGNDQYQVFVAGDTIIELPGEGDSDRVVSYLPVFVLPANVEYLNYSGTESFTGIGNDGAYNEIAGGTGADTLVGLGGNDTLRGGTGAANTLLGGTGDDFYVVEAIGDSVIELAGEGNDSVSARVSVFTLPDHVERLSYFGTGAFTGTGNALDNPIYGGSGGDTLFGLDGDDDLGGSLDFNTPDSAANTLIGGRGNDSYIVYTPGDSVVEFANEGHDEILVWAANISSYVLPADVEDLFVLSGINPFTAIGNALGNRIDGGQSNDFLSGLDGNDTINGGFGNDMIFGGNGSDVMNGGSGADTFFLYGNESGLDTINGFEAGGIDRIALSRSTFGLTATVDFLSAFGSLPTPTSNNSTLLYNTDTRQLYLDVDGNGPIAAVQILQMSPGVPLALGDFVFF